jgi:DNA ligase-1
MITRPMLACDTENADDLIFPMIATPKIDGIRCLNVDGEILSRSFKPIPNIYIRNTLAKISPPGADGELFSSKHFNEVTSAVMSRAGEPDFTYYMFDYVIDGDVAMPYSERLEAMVSWYRSVNSATKRIVKILPFKVINSFEELKTYEEQALKDGHEGTILRKPDGPYKCGRSTWKERYLLKLKPFKDSEARVIGFEEMMSNQNKAEKDEFGLMKRSSAKSGKTPTGRMGKFMCIDIHTGVEFKCGMGVGLTMELRKKIWDNQNEYINRIMKYSYQPHGTKDKPRIPKWLGFRDERDM